MKLELSSLYTRAGALFLAWPVIGSKAFVAHPFSPSHLPKAECASCRQRTECPLSSALSLRAGLLMPSSRYTNTQLRRQHQQHQQRQKHHQNLSCRLSTSGCPPSLLPLVLNDRPARDIQHQAFSTGINISPSISGTMKRPGGTALCSGGGGAGEGGGGQQQGPGTQQLSRQAKLAISVLIDLVGMSSYAVPGLGEATDLGWAPISSALIFYLYGNSIFAGLAFVEEILPGFDVIPTATIAWFLTNSDVGQNVTNAAAGKTRNDSKTDSSWVPPPPPPPPSSASTGSGGSRKLDGESVKSGFIDVEAES